jgi:ATP-dependent Lon protease
MGPLMPDSDQIEAPLFPLPNLVLFPSVRLPLHIFEERYKTMINACVENTMPFGVVLLTGETETASNISKVGVLAQITQVERLDDGRMNIITEGVKRIRILQLLEPSPFWRGIVEPLDDRYEPETIVEELREEAVELYVEAYRKGVKLTGARPAELAVPASASELSFLIAYVLDMDCAEKQRLLEMISLRDRLVSLIDYLKRANDNLQQQVHQKQIEEKARGNGRLGRG